MASPPKPWKAEYAKSARSSCKTCKNAIGKDQFRLGKMVVATQFDGFMPMWNHASCVLKKKNQIKALGDVEGIDLLRWDDQEKIRKYIDDGSSGASSVSAGDSSSTSVLNDDSAIDVSPSSRASCKKCNEKIQKGTIRVSTKREGMGAKGLQWYHVNCFIEMSPSTDIKKVFGWDKLDPEEKENILSLLKKKNTVNEEDEKKDLKGTKRKKGASDEKPTAKAPKLEETSSRKVDASKSGLSDSDLEKKLKEQSELLWSIKDELKKNVSTAEMRDMLEENDQGSSGSEYDLRDCCADGMLFGALGPCPICSGSIRYAGGQYKCHGYASAWSKCSYSTTDAVRLKGKWKIPEGTTNEFLLKWFKSQKVKKPSRVLPPLTPCSSVLNHPNTQSSVAKGVVTVKVKGRSAVHEASGLQDPGHILEVGKSIYNTTLNMSDLWTGINSYYILQIIEADKGSDCYVFRKWGRVGNEKIGGKKLEKMLKDDAVHKFKRLFRKYAGNPWEAWEQKKNFEKQPGRFFPLDIV